MQMTEWFWEKINSSFQVNPLCEKMELLASLHHVRKWVQALELDRIQE